MFSLTPLRSDTFLHGANTKMTFQMWLAAHIMSHVIYCNALWTKKGGSFRLCAAAVARVLYQHQIVTCHQAEMSESKWQWRCAHKRHSIHPRTKWSHTCTQYNWYCIYCTLFSSHRYNLPSFGVSLGEIRLLHPSSRWWHNVAKGEKSSLIGQRIDDSEHISNMY